MASTKKAPKKDSRRIQSVRVLTCTICGSTIKL